MAEEERTIGMFLVNLSRDPDRLERYFEDAESVVRESGLPEEKQEILLSGDTRRLIEELENEYGMAFGPWRPIRFPLPIWIRGPVHRTDT
jgi:hypothetical protein